MRAIEDWVGLLAAPVVAVPPELTGGLVGASEDLDADAPARPASPAASVHDGSSVFGGACRLVPHSAMPRFMVLRSLALRGDGLRP